MVKWKRFPFPWPASVPFPLAYYWLDDGEGSGLHDSVSGQQRGSVTYEAADQPSPYPGANWVGDSKFGTTIACGSATTGQKDTLELADLDYGTSGAWALNFWVRNPPGSDFAGAQREQFFGHGDPLMPTTTRNQVHLQFESSGAVRTIVYDGTDADRNSVCPPPCTACDDSHSSECRKLRSSVGGSTDSEPVFGSVTDEQWHMLTLTTHPGIAHTKGYTLYIDGQTRANSPHIEGVGVDNYGGDPASRAQTANGGDPIQPKGPMRLCGRAMDEDNDGVPDFNDNRYFMGQVAHVSVYDFALSQSQVAFLHSLYDKTSVDVYRAGGDHAADSRGSGGGGGGGDGGSGWLYALGLLLGLGSLLAYRLERVKQWLARWRGSPRERHLRRALPGIVVVTVFVIGVVIGNGGGGGSFAWGLLTSYPLAGLLFIATRLYAGSVTSS